MFSQPGPILFEISLIETLPFKTSQSLPGLHKEYKKVEKYFEFVSVKANQKEHRGFLTARKEWIKQHNEGGPDSKRLKSKKQLLEARKQLEVTKQVGGRFTCPKKQFVSVEAWNPKKHGDLDQSKVVTENIMGQDVRGQGAERSL